MSRGSKRLRVAQFVEVLESGGAEALAIDIAGALAARGHDSHLVVLRGDGPFRARVGDDVVVHDLNRPRQDGNQVVRIFYFLETARRLEALLMAEGIEVLQTHLPKANFLGLAMAWRNVCRVYPTVHNNREFDYGTRVSRLKYAVRRAAYRQMLTRCRSVIAVSAQVKASLGRELGLPASAVDGVSVVPNGARVLPPVDPVERTRLRSLWGIGDDQVLVVSVGRLTAQKNFAALVDALAPLARQDDSWQCIVAGEGELRPDLEQQVAAAGLTGRIRMPGLVSDVPSLLAAADIFCLPSRFEGLPLVLLEAMGAGLPVIAFAIDGVVDVVVDGRQALLAPPGDVDALSSALGAMVADAAMRREFGAAARALAEEQYGFPVMVDRLERVYGQ